MKGEPFSPERLRELIEAATPGPWEAFENCLRTVDAGRCVARLDWDIRDHVDDANAALIVYLRNHATELASPPPTTTPVDDVMQETAKRNLRYFIGNAAFKCEVDREAAMNCLDVVEEEISGLNDLVAVLRSALRAYAQIAATPVDDRETPSGQAMGEIVRDLVCAAYLAGAEAVHDHWAEQHPLEMRGDPEFGEAASDYVAAVDFAALTTAIPLIQAQERERIVAWLRSDDAKWHHPLTDEAIATIADAIEQGVAVKGGEG